MKTFRLSRLYRFTRCLWQMESAQYSQQYESPLLKLLLNDIESRGPITVAQYMQRALTCPSLGYYVRDREHFGEKGDFITSPEFSQLLGEMLAVWCIHEVLQLAHDGSFNLVELGPGSGLLMSDMLRTFSHFEMTSRLSVHMVEISPALVRRQKELLCGPLDGKTMFGQPIFWHNSVDDVPDGFSFFIAHEFFDAMPVHKFKKVENVWREVLVDKGEGDELRFCLAPGVTPSQSAYLDDTLPADACDWEVSPASAVVMQSLAKKITSFGGAALVVDYGQDGNGGDTLRAYSSHKQVDPLSNPGFCDLTADVDFNYLRQQVNNEVYTIGPISQRNFLLNMGMVFRLERLLHRAKTKEQRDFLRASYDYLIDPSKMGSRFKVFAMFPKVLRKYLDVKPPAGFEGPMSSQTR
ncbi:protein midA, mitochondrial [Trichuris trichiura]|uniref:Protein arginine methyltransferase NDUFAF7 n=1 Tax=Trichuris trichiura TaxID=36087 RepID=A0A077Z1Y3_TRITR|nr:protein midA, mitochondrial [Trichuris trichiura]